MSEPLFVSDSELTARLGIGEKCARKAIRALERHRNFPPRDPLFGNRRYWPAVRAFLDARAGIKTVEPVADGEEDFDAIETGKAGGAGDAGA